MRGTISHVHRSARDLDAANRRRAPPVDEIVHLLEGDPDLATVVLRLANSRLFPGQEETQYLTTAVARVGARTVHAVAETLALRDGYPIRSTDLPTLHERIWRFSVARGLAMRAIAEVTGPEVALEPDRCYLGGLLLDAGAAFLLWTLDESRREPAAAGARRSRRGGRGAVGLPPRVWSGGAVALGHAGRSGGAGARSPRSCAPGPRIADVVGVAAGAPAGGRLVGFDDPTSPSQPRPELLDRCAYALGVGDTVLRRLSATLADDTRVHWEMYA